LNPELRDFENPGVLFIKLSTLHLEGLGRFRGMNIHGSVD
jgi:hypothetical protein